MTKSYAITLVTAIVAFAIGSLSGSLWTSTLSDDEVQQELEVTCFLDDEKKVEMQGQGISMVVSSNGESSLLGVSSNGVIDLSNGATCVARAKVEAA